MCGGSPVSLLSQYHRCQLRRMLLSREFWYTSLMSTPLYRAYCMHTALSRTQHFVFGTDRKLYYANIKSEVIIINYGKISFSFLCKSCSPEQRMNLLSKKLPMKTKEHTTSGPKCAGPVAIGLHMLCSILNSVSVRPCGVSSPLHTSPRSCCAYSGFMLLKIVAFLQKKRMRATCNYFSLYIDRHVPSFIYLLINLNIRHTVYGAGTPPDDMERPIQKQAGKEFMLKTQ